MKKNKHDFQIQIDNTFFILHFILNERLQVKLLISTQGIHIA